MTKQILPRVQGKVLPKGSGFTFEVYVTVGPDDGWEMTVHADKDQTYLTRLSALNALKERGAEVLKLIIKALGNPEVLGVIDLKAGVTTTLEEFARPEKPAAS